MITFKNIEHPQIFFNHHQINPKYEYLGNCKLICDETGKKLRNVVYTNIVHFNNEIINETDTHILLWKLEEVRYPQHIIDSCNKKYKHTESDCYHIIKKYCIIDKQTGEEIYCAPNEYIQVNLYDKLITIYNKLNTAEYEVYNINQFDNLIWKGFSSNLHIGKKSITIFGNIYNDKFDVQVYDMKTGTLQYKI